MGNSDNTKEKVKIIRVSSKTDPKQLAYSMKYSLAENLQIKAYAIGESIKVLNKALAMLNIFTRNKNLFDFQPSLEYTTDDNGVIKNVLVWNITNK